MGWVVVSETVRRVRRDESYSREPGPAIPGGLLHAKPLHGSHTLCEVDTADLHAWPHLEFPRHYGTHCPDCLAVTGRVVDLTETGERSRA